MEIGGTKLALLRGDLTREPADAIVNAANPSLMGGGGVDGAIHRAGGPAILSECRRIRAERGECATGDAVLTTAGDLPARWVVHTVGPIWRGGVHGEAELLSSCYRTSLAVAAGAGAATVAFPSISTGAYGYPVAEAARVAIAAVLSFLRADARLQEVRFVLFSDPDLSVYEEALREATG